MHENIAENEYVRFSAFLFKEKNKRRTNSISSLNVHLLCMQQRVLSVNLFHILPTLPTKITLIKEDPFPFFILVSSARVVHDADLFFRKGPFLVFEKYGYEYR